MSRLRRLLQAAEPALCLPGKQLPSSSSHQPCLAPANQVIVGFSSACPPPPGQCLTEHLAPEPCWGATRRQAEALGPCRRQWGVFLAQIPLEKQLVNPTLSALPSSLAGSSGCCLGNPQWGATALGVPVTHTQVPAKGFRAPSSSGASLQPLCGLPGSGMPPVRWRSGLRGRPRGFGLSKVSEPGFQHTTVPQ